MSTDVIVLDSDDGEALECKVSISRGTQSQLRGTSSSEPVGNYTELREPGTFSSSNQVICLSDEGDESSPDCSSFEPKYIGLRKGQEFSKYPWEKYYSSVSIREHSSFQQELDDSMHTEPGDLGISEAKLHCGDEKFLDDDDDDDTVKCSTLDLNSTASFAQRKNLPSTDVSGHLLPGAQLDFGTNAFFDDREDDLCPNARKDLQKRKRQAAMPRNVIRRHSHSRARHGNMHITACSRRGDKESLGSNVSRQRSDQAREKERDKREKQRQCNIEKFNKFESKSHDYMREGICIILAAGFAQNEVKLTDMLHCALRAKVVVAKSASLQNAVQWGRRKPVGDCNYSEARVGDHLPFASVICDAVTFWKHVQRRSLAQFASDVKCALPGKRIELVLLGVDEYWKRKLRAASCKYIPASSTAIQENCISLYMQFGITTRRLSNMDEVGSYLIATTDSLVRAQNRKRSNFLDANLDYRKTDAGGRVTYEDRDGRLHLERSSDIGVTYLNIMTQIPGISLEKAKAIRDTFPTLHSLLSNYDACCSDSRRDNMLTDLKFGISGSRRIGPAASKLVANVFTSRDPALLVQSAFNVDIASQDDNGGNASASF